MLFRSPGACEEAHSSGDIVRAVALIEMHSSLGINDPRPADLVEHEAADVPFDGRAWQAPDLAIRNNALSRRILD